MDHSCTLHVAPQAEMKGFVCDATYNAHELDTNDSYNIFEPFMDIICSAAGKKSYYWKEISKNYKKFYPDNKKILSYC